MTNWKMQDPLVTTYSMISLSKILIYDYVSSVHVKILFFIFSWRNICPGQKKERKTYKRMYTNSESCKWAGKKNKRGRKYHQSNRVDPVNQFFHLIQGNTINPINSLYPVNPMNLRYPMYSVTLRIWGIPRITIIQ